MARRRTDPTLFDPLDLDTRILQKERLLRELDDLMASQRHRTAAMAEWCYRRAMTRIGTAMNHAGGYRLESRSGGGTRIVEQQDQPFAMSDYARRTREIQER